MYVKVRPMSGGAEQCLTVSKLTKIEELRVLVNEKFSVAVEKQRLFFQGKQLEDGHSLYDYNLNINDVIQLMERQAVAAPAAAKENLLGEGEDKENEVTVRQTEFYKVGDLVDASHDGSWWEAKIIKITNAKTTNKSDETNDKYSYHVEFERYKYELPSVVSLIQIRPRACHRLEMSDLKLGDRVMVNHNIEEPQERGFWYHAKVESVMDTKTLVVSLLSGEEWLSGCVILFTDEILQIPQHVKLEDRLKEKPISRVSAPSCTHCLDNHRRKCRECGCSKCGGRESPEKQIMCDECDKAYHIYCLSPPMQSLPDVEEWFCPDCKNDETEIVRAGEKLKSSKKSSKKVAKNTTSTRDWGKGFACAGRSKHCTIVSQNHYGPIPGVEVGSQWLYRIQASEAGVHRPPVSGIHGRSDDGSYSIVLSGGYEDDEDNGEHFTYTGSGGRDLSGNKRTAEQSKDQTLTNTNKALALNCNCKLSLSGGDAGDDWKGGKPLRVIRSYKGRKHSNYAPEEGVRYDGIYKVCKYWLEAGKSGFKVVRYLMRRDDPVPAPWTKEGEKRIKELGLVIQYPPDMDKSKKGEDKKGIKRKNDKENEEDDSVPSAKKRKSDSPSYTLDTDTKKLVKSDSENEKVWQTCLQAAKGGYQSFISSVESEFSCVCCQEILLRPVTTPCHHNACQDCLQRSFKAEVYNCPACRHDLTMNYKMPINEKLFGALKKIFPGYRST